MWKLIAGSKPILAAFGGMLAIIIALSVALVVNHLRLELQVAQAETRLATATGANATWKQSTENLSGKLQTCIGERQAIEEAAAKAIAATQATRQELAAERRKRITEREKLYAADPQCAQWAAGAVCAGVDQRLPE